MTFAAKTFFDRASMPTNLLTVPEFRHLGQVSFGGLSWKLTARKVAGLRGGALVMKADGSLVVFTKRNDGISQKTYKNGQWGWEN